MVQFLSINFFLGFLQFLLGFSKVPVFFVSPVFGCMICVLLILKVMYYYYYYYYYYYVYVFLFLYALFCIFCFHRTNWHSSTILTGGFPCFFFTCKANARVYLAKMGHGPHCS